MAQNVANRLQRDVRPQQAHCPRVADGVWSALTFRLDTGQPDATAEHRVKAGPTGKGTERCVYLNENLSQRCLQSSLAELVRWETPRLCRGGSRSLTDTGVHRGDSQT